MSLLGRCALRWAAVPALPPLPFQAGQCEHALSRTPSPLPGGWDGPSWLPAMQRQIRLQQQPAKAMAGSYVKVCQVVQVQGHHTCASNAAAAEIIC